MEKNKLIDILKEEIKNSPSLSPRDKFWGQWMVDRLKYLEKNNNLRELVNHLSDMYDSETDDYNKKVLSDVITILNRDIRKMDFLLEDGKYSPRFDDYSLITFEKILESISEGIEITEDGKIVITPKISAKDLLGRVVNIGNDDGMGYSPNGFNGVFQSYLGDDNDIKLWI